MNTRKPRRHDLKDHTYGRLTVLDFASSNRYGAIWKCRCVCGKELNVAATRLKSGNTKSCGCLKREMLAGGTGRFKVTE